MAIFIGRRPETAFTRVPNDWARDPKLSTRAKGLLTYLLSHRDGYRLTVQQVIAENADGRDAIYKTIGELVEHGYLRKDQRRGERGKMGEVDYYVADAPQVTTASGFTASGESGSGDDQGKQDETAGGTASWFTGYGATGSGESDTKKTRVLEDQVLEDEKTISLSAREDATDPEASGVELEPEREIDDASLNQTDNPIHRLLLDAGCPSEKLTEAERWIADECNVQGLGWWITAGRNKTLNANVAAFLEGGPVAALCPDCDGTGETGDWMNRRSCPCLWQSDPDRARKAFIPLLKDFPPCVHGVAGGDQKAPNGWQYCSQCRGPGWVDRDVQPRTEERSHTFKRSTSTLRAEQGLAVADELDREFGHGRYAQRQIRSPADRVVADAGPLYRKYKAREQHKPWMNPPDDSVYLEDWPNRTEHDLSAFEGTL